LSRFKRFFIFQRFNVFFLFFQPVAAPAIGLGAQAHTNFAQAHLNAMDNDKS